MTTAITADAFIDTLGVDTHIGIAGAYSDLSQVEQDLSYLGVPTVRDSIDSASMIATWQAVAQAAGVKFDDFMPEGAPSWEQSALALVPQLVQDGLLSYVEGGNEEDDSYATGNGNSLAWTAQFQQQVYAMGKQEGIPVINMSFGQGWTAANNWEGDYPDVGNLSAYTTYANAHTYPNVGETPQASMTLLNSDAKLAASSRQVITTEMGWQTSQFSETQIAQYMVDATFDGIADGDAGTWFYGLYDDSSGTWGLFNSDGSARPAATALHDLTTLLKDTGSNAGSFTPGSLNYSLSGTVSGDNSFLIEKSNGTFWIGLWNESAGQHTVTVNLPATASQIEVYDPVTGTSVIQNVSNAGSIAVSLGGDPLLIEVVPTGITVTTTSSGSTTTGTSSTTTTSSSSTAGTPEDLTVAVPGTETVATGASKAITGVSISDAWAASSSGLMALNVWDQSGTLTIDGKTFGAGGGPVAGGMFSGSLAQLNADLATLSYNAAGTAGSDTVTVDVWNQAGVEAKETIAVTVSGSGTSTSGSSGNSGSASATGTTTTSGSGTTTASAGGAAGTATDLTVTGPSAETLAAGATKSISGVSISDSWAAGTNGTMALNVWDQSGTLTIDGKTFGPGGAAVAGGMFQGTLAQLNADLATLSYTASGTAGSDTITVDVWNQAGVEVKETVPVTVTAAGSTGTTTGTTTSGSSSSTPATTSTITIAASNASPVEQVSNAAITATSGNHMLFIGGTGDVVMLTGGTETVQAFQGSNTITTGTGNDTIQIAGSGNVVNAGAGTNTIEDSGTNNTIVLPAAGGTDDIYGYVMQNGDTLDLRTALASTSWNGTEGTLGNYLSVSAQGTNALITLHPTGSASGSVIATLQDAGPVTLSALLQHSIT